MSKANFTRHDKTGKPTRTAFHIPELTAANFDATVTNMQALNTTLNALCDADATVCTINKEPVRAAKAELGQNQSKWLIKVRSLATPFREYLYELGTADVTRPTIVGGGREYLDPASTEYSALETQLESNILDPDGNAIELISVELVGRNI